MYFHLCAWGQGKHGLICKHDASLVKGCWSWENRTWRFWAIQYKTFCYWNRFWNTSKAYIQCYFQIIDVLQCLEKQKNTMQNRLPNPFQITWSLEFVSTVSSVRHFPLQDLMNQCIVPGRCGFTNHGPSCKMRWSTSHTSYTHSCDVFWSRANFEAEKQWLLSLQQYRGNTSVLRSRTC